MRLTTNAKDRGVFAKIAAPVVRNGYFDEDAVKEFISDENINMYTIPKDNFDKILNNFQKLENKDKNGVEMEKKEANCVLHPLSTEKHNEVIYRKIKKDLKLMSFLSLYNKFATGYAYFNTDTKKITITHL